MDLKKTKETASGLNTEFVNLDSGRHFTLDHIINQIENGNSNYDDYSVVHMQNGTDYIRSNPDGKKANNIE